MDLEQRVERLETEVAAMKTSIQKNTEVVAPPSGGLLLLGVG